MLVVKEIVLAIDPGLRKLEEILLWKNKIKTCGIFTFCHFLFWLFQNFNIRTYCIISLAALALHILDAYRTKKRRELMRIQQSKPNIIENISTLGRYILFLNEKLQLIWTKFCKIKQKNRLQYFLILFVFWSMTAIIGTKIRGVYLAYMTFWVVFFLPPILHYDVPRKLLCKALPILEQLDHSMKYKRRSLLDKNELLVDVKLPVSDQLDEEIENEYLESFKLDDLSAMQPKERKVIENLQDDEDDDDEDDEVADQSSNRQQRIIKSTAPAEADEQLTSESDSQFGLPSFSSAAIGRFLNGNSYEEDDGMNSFMPNESLPNISGLDFTSPGDKVLRRRSGKTRPSVLNYHYQQQQQKATNKSHGAGDEKDDDDEFDLRRNQQNVEETFDFLDEYENIN